MPAWSRRGYEERLKEGREEGKEKAALNMLREGMEISLIAKVTGLSQVQVAKLKKQTN
ncbi:hypothetical protein LMZ02_31425 [Paenibacillus macerans]|uniref:Transposase n=1 Tax=Paenibacillus macerans TaxID=44252 RepID=A0A090ZGN6_PAEMA|nr:hypothetical protein [Paenibacillus macerans]KFN10484.1 hypothetical protein DJ90_792 [Paenibacillus macerans]MBS5914394.1 hypothetical protein [Paenibacillus macerans]MCY7562315.1 hypothetical protein [Paenibacillus macerans]MEC0149519.1 hypothetical protein [Paenibacillus macerans]MEC0333484.1 hypothetical protein [Paenibacillus macerans]